MYAVQYQIQPIYRILWPTIVIGISDENRRVHNVWKGYSVKKYIPMNLYNSARKGHFLLFGSSKYLFQGVSEVGHNTK